MPANPHRPSGSPRCPSCRKQSKPHCPKQLEGCRWNVCQSGHIFDLKTRHILGTDVSINELKERKKRDV